MFDIGWSELLVIGIVALIAIGPKELPGVLRAVGQWMGKIRRMASEFQGQFQEAMREAEMDDLKKQVDEMTSVATDVANFDPIGSVRKEFEGAFEDKPAPSEPPSEPSTSTAGASPEAAAPATPAPVAAAEHDLALAPQAPQPKAGSGA